MLALQWGTTMPEGAMMTTEMDDGCCGASRRRFLAAGGIGLVAAVVGGGTAVPAAAAALTEAQRDAMTPDQVVQLMLDGNARFAAGEQRERDFLAEQQATAGGQYPAAVAISCVDSRTPIEVICDLGLGDTFNARLAGNVVNDDVLGSMEFACAVAGAKLVVVMGHTACGAVKGAIDDVVLGNLTGLVAKIRPAIVATDYAGERSSKNPEFVDAVARTNVVQCVEQIRERSRVLRELEEKGAIKIVGAMYDLGTAKLALT